MKQRLTTYFGADAISEGCAEAKPRPLPGRLSRWMQFPRVVLRQRKCAYGRENATKDAISEGCAEAKRPSMASAAAFVGDAISEGCAEAKR